jgi:hypothetical protein
MKMAMKKYMKEIQKMERQNNDAQVVMVAFPNDNGERFLPKEGKLKKKRRQPANESD